MTIHCSRSQKLAFTLLELLVCVSIIALLAAILMPIIASTKRASMRTTCLSNLHNIGLAFQLYGSDADDYYPAAIDRYTRDHPYFLPASHPYSPSMPDLVTVLSPYVGSNTGVWRCPADLLPFTRTIDEQAVAPPYPNYYSYAGTSYIWLVWYFAEPETYLPQPPQPLARDFNNLWHSEYADPDLYGKSQDALFSDGHVRFVALVDEQ